MSGPDPNQSAGGPPPPPSAEQQALPLTPTGVGGAPSPPPPPPAAARPSPLAGLLSSLSQAEQLILGGALLVLLVDLVFGIVIRAYIISDVVWAAAAGALMVAWLHRRSPAMLPLRYETVLLVLAALAAIVAARKVLSDLLFVLRPPIGADGTFVLGMLGLAVGAAAMGAGVWLLARDRT